VAFGSSDVTSSEGVLPHVESAEGVSGVKVSQELKGTCFKCDGMSQMQSIICTDEDKLVQDVGVGVGQPNQS
jgi:hypothetical protein